MTPNECPNCGVNLSARAYACPECGACPETGWTNEAQYESIQLQEEEFDYDDFLKREFGQGGRPRYKRLHWVWIIVAILLVLFFLTHAW